MGPAWSERDWYRPSQHKPRPEGVLIPPPYTVACRMRDQRTIGPLQPNDCEQRHNPPRQSHRSDTQGLHPQFACRLPHNVQPHICRQKRSVGCPSIQQQLPGIQWQYTAVAARNFLPAIVHPGDALPTQSNHRLNISYQETGAPRYRKAELPPVWASTQGQTYPSEPNKRSHRVSAQLPLDNLFRGHPHGPDALFQRCRTAARSYPRFPHHRRPPFREGNQWQPQMQR